MCVLCGHVEAVCVDMCRQCVHVCRHVEAVCVYVCVCCGTSMCEYVYWEACVYCGVCGA